MTFRNLRARSLPATLLTFLGWTTFLGPSLPAQDNGRVRVTGSVFDADGRPMPGVTVSLCPVMDDFGAYVYWLDGRRMWAVPVDVAATGRDGRYALEGAAGVRWRLLVEHPRRATVTRRLEPLYADREMEPVELGPAFPLEVLVRTVDGAAVEGARLMGSSAALTDDLWPYSWSAAKTDASGLARLLVAPQEPWTFQVAADGLVPVEEVHRGKPQTEVELSAGSRLALELRRESGEPAAGAVVFFPLKGVTLGRSDAAGRLTLHGEPGSRQTIRALTADGAAVEADVTFPAAGRSGERALELGPPRDLDVEVTGISGAEPIPRAVAWLQDDRVVVGDAYGRVRLRIPVYQSEVTLRVSARDHLPWSSRSVDVSEVVGRPWSVGLEPAAVLRGRVVDAAGRPLAGAALDLVSGRHPWDGDRQRSFPEGRDGRTAEDGRFVLSDVPTGRRLQLVARKAGYAAERQALDPLVPFERRGDVELVMTQGRRAVGVVVDEDDRPVAEASVELHGWPPREAGSEEPGDWLAAAATTDASGRFELEDLGPGVFALQVRGTGFVPAEYPGIEIPGAGREVDLGAMRVEKGHAIAGRAIDEAGAPLEGVEVKVSAVRVAGLGGSVAASTLVTDGEGRFLFPTRAAGVYRLEARGTGFVSAWLESVEVPQEVSAELVMRRGAVLRGTVVNAGGEPVPGAGVTCRARNGSLEWIETTTDDAGRFRLGPLAAAEHAVDVDAEGYRSQEHKVQVLAGADPEPLSVELSRVATLAGSVTRPDGRPVSEATVAVRPADRDDGWIYAGTDREGRFEIEQAPFGPVVVVASLGSAEARADVDVRPDGMELSLTLPAGVNVSGRVADQDGAPVSGAQVTLASAPKAGAWSGADGRFSFEDVLPGRYRLDAEHPDFADLDERSMIEVESEPIAGLEVTLRRGAEVSGRIEGVEPSDLVGLRVAIARLYESGRPGSGGETALSDVDGRFRFPHLLPGEYVATVESVSTREVIATGRFELPEGVDALEIELRPVAGVEVRGRVLHRGVGVPNLRVGLPVDHESITAQTAADGSFVLRRVPEGLRTLRVYDPEGQVHEREIEVRDGGVEVLVELPPGEVSGTVRDAATGEAVAGARVHLERLEPGPLRSLTWESRVLREDKSDAAGVFVLRSLEPGRYRIRAVGSGFEPPTLGMAEVELSSDPVRGVVVEVEGSHRLTLRLSATDPDGDRLVYVLVDPAGRPEKAGGESYGRDGRVVVEAVPAGDWRLWVATPSSAWQELRVVSPVAGEIPVTLSAGGAVRFPIPDLSDEAVDVVVDLRDAGGRRPPFLPGAMSVARHLEDQGYLGNLWPGEWTLEIRETGGTTWRAVFTIRAGETVDVVPAR